MLSMSMKLNNHISMREHFYRSVPDFLHNNNDSEYALYDIMTITSQEKDDIHLVTERIAAIFFKITALLQNVPSHILIEMGYPSALIPLMRVNTLPVPSVIARLDIIPYEDTYKCIEINAETPTFINECYRVNSKVCAHFGLKDPNEGLLSYLEAAVNVAVRTNKYKSLPNIVFTANVDNPEDIQTSLFLQGSVAGSHFVALEHLTIVQGEGVYDDLGNKIDILYRQTYSLESFISDLDSEGNPIGLWLVDLVADNKLTLINPPASLLMQNKAVMSVIWGLHEANDYFTDVEHEWIEKYFLPTYLEPEVFSDNKVPYVQKSIFGREGDAVRIFNDDGELVADNGSPAAGACIYQKHVPQTKTVITTTLGDRETELVYSCFVINGKAGAIGCRAGTMITDHISYFLPIGVR